MPAAIPLAVAGVGAVGGIINAKMQSNANKRATEAQNHGTDAALAYQREKDAAIKAESDREWADYQRRYDAWEARRPGGGGGGSQRIGPGMVGAGPGFTQTEKLAPGQLGPLRGATVADLMGGGVSAASDVSGTAPQGVIESDLKPGASLADLARWSDHRQYLGGA